MIHSRLPKELIGQYEPSVLKNYLMREGEGGGEEGDERSGNQVCPQTQFYSVCIFLVKISLIGPEGKPMTPHQGGCCFLSFLATTKRFFVFDT